MDRLQTWRGSQIGALGTEQSMFARLLRWVLPAAAMWAWRRYSSRRSSNRRTAT